MATTNPIENVEEAMARLGTTVSTLATLLHETPLPDPTANAARSVRDDADSLWHLLNDHLDHLLREAAKEAD